MRKVGGRASAFGRALLGASLLALAMPQASLAQSGGSLGQSGLVGQLEGAEILTDAAAIPKAFQEAPQLAELVKQGKLPPVKDRLPAEPLVVKPLHSVGKYGGTWRRGFTGPGDVRERQPHQRVRQAAVLGLHRHQDRAERGQERGHERGRQGLHASTCARA